MSDLEKRKKENEKRKTNEDNKNSVNYIDFGNNICVQQMNHLFAHLIIRKINQV